MFEGDERMLILKLNWGEEVMEERDGLNVRRLWGGYDTRRKREMSGGKWRISGVGVKSEWN